MGAVLRLIDPCAFRAYADAGDLRVLGGAKATALRIVAALARPCDIRLEQSARQIPTRQNGVAFVPMDLKVQSNDLTVVINSWMVALAVALPNPAARVYVWQRVMPGRHNRILAAGMAAGNMTLLCASQSLRNTLATMHTAPVRMQVL